MSLYAIGIGGTGAKCLEALAQVAAVGLLNSSENSPIEQTIHTLFVDADETNGSLERARGSIEKYQRCYDLFEQNRAGQPWMQSQIKPLGLWSPLGSVTTEKKLEALFSYDSLKQPSPELSSLVDVLFTPEELEANLEVGFRGRPAIGSAVMSQIDLDALNEPVWRQLIDNIRLDVGNKGRFPKIVLFGSIFGGTGASGIPTIGRLLHEKLKAENLRDRVSIASAFMLPYFSFTPAAGLEKDEVYARADQFLLNTEAALRYYVTQGKPFDTVYVLGDHNSSEVEFSLGKTSQRNRPHFIEMFAALGARHFLQTETSSGGTQVALMSRQHDSRVGWNDLPDSGASKTLLSNTTRFAYVWLANIAPDLEQAKAIGVKSFISGAPWFRQFFKPPASAFGRMMGNSGEALPDFNDPEQQKALFLLTEWCLDYMRWLSDIHQCGEEVIRLFNLDCLRKARGTEVIPDELSRVVLGMETDRSRQERDSIPELKRRLDDPNLAAQYGQGTIGLARAIYALASI